MRRIETSIQTLATSDSSQPIRIRNGFLDARIAAIRPRRGAGLPRPR
jgi:hypothetical protein